MRNFLLSKRILTLNSGNVTIIHYLMEFKTMQSDVMRIQGCTRRQCPCILNVRLLPPVLSIHKLRIMQRIPSHGVINPKTMEIFRSRIFEQYFHLILLRDLLNEMKFCLEFRAILILAFSELRNKSIREQSFADYVFLRL